MYARYGIALALGASLAVSGCSQENLSHAPEAAASTPSSAGTIASSSRSVPTLERLREGVRYVAYETPEQLLADRAVGLIGVIDAVFEGRSLISESEPYSTRDNSVVVRVEVTQTIKDPQGLVQAQTAYVSLPRGSNALNSDGTIVGEDPNPSVAEVREALPVGLRVLVISQPEDRMLPLENPAVSVGEEPHPLRGGAVLLEGIHPQTFVVDQGDGAVMGWPDRTFAELLEELGV